MKRWFVLYTKPNQELKVEEQLKKMGIISYCPTIQMVKSYSDRKKKIIKPLMPSYVMVNIEENNRNDVFSVYGVVRYLFWLGKPAEIRESEIKLMRDYLSGEYESVSLSSFVKGQMHKISEGIFSGRTGKVIEAQKNKIKLELKSLGVIVTLRLKVL